MADVKIKVRAIQRSSIMKYDIKKIADDAHIYAITVDKLISEYDYYDLKNEAFELIEAFEEVSFVVDLEALSYLNSSGLNLLIQLLTKTRNSKGETVIINVSNQIDNLLIVTKIKSLFLTFSTKEEAVGYLKSQKENTADLEQLNT